MIKSKYPIVMSAMNQVSDLNLAIAGFNAGISPSLILTLYWNYGNIDLKRFESDLHVYYEKTCSKDLIISMSADHLLNENVWDVLVRNNFLTIEIIDGITRDNRLQIQNLRKHWKNRGFQLLTKTVNPILFMETDFLVLKGNEASGTISPEFTLKESFKIMRDSFPSLNIIPTGGIASSEDIVYYIKQGAAAVGIGSLFAFSEESRISQETKQKIVSSTSKDLTLLKNKKQQGIVFKEIEVDNANNTNSLKLGIQGTNIGHVFMGKSVDSINSIRTVNEIVSDLIKQL